MRGDLILHLILMFPSTTLTTYLIDHVKKRLNNFNLDKRKYICEQLGKF